MAQVTIHLVGTAEEVAEALRVLAGPLLPPNATLMPHNATPAVITEQIVPPAVIPESTVTPREGPYSDALCAREGCHNKLTVKQVRQGSKYCSMSCAGMARRGVARAKAAPAEVTIVAGEGITKGTALSPETPSRLPVPS